MNIIEIRVEKISSVNREIYSTMFDKEKNDDINKNKLDHKPIHEYTGRNGR